MVIDHHAHKGADLIEIDAPRDRHHGQHEKACIRCVPDRPLFDREQALRTADQLIGTLVKAVELEIELELVTPCVERSQALDKVRIRSEPESIGVDVNLTDTPLEADFDEALEVRVDGWLAARQLHHVGIALPGLKQPVQFPCELLDGHLPREVWRRGRVTRRAAQIALLRDLEDEGAAVAEQTALATAAEVGSIGV